MSEKILVSGFDRFGRLQRPNPSSEVALPAIKEKYGELVETVVLPTARTVAAEQLIEAIEEIHPAAVVMFGVSAGKKVRLEKRAKNVRYNLLIPDNLGVRAAGPIDEYGPSEQLATLPLTAIYDRLSAANAPVKMSRNAGTFVCNEVMYKVLQHMGETENSSVIPTGFIHLGNGLSSQLVEEASLVVVDELIKYPDSGK